MLNGKKMIITTNGHMKLFIFSSVENFVKHKHQRFFIYFKSAKSGAKSIGN